MSSSLSQVHWCQSTVLGDDTHGETLTDSRPNSLNSIITMLLLRLLFASPRCILLHAEENGPRLEARFRVYDTSSSGKIEANELEEGIYSMGVRH